MRKYILATTLVVFSGLCAAQIRLLDNKGQYPDSFKYVGNLPAGRVFIESSQLRYEFTDFNYSHDHNHEDLAHRSEAHDAVQGHAYFISFIEPNAEVELIGKTEPGAVHHNYFVGEKSNWASGVKDHNQITFKDIFNGIDYKYYKFGNTVKYDFIIQPHGDMTDIKWRIQGANDLYIDEIGNLNIVTDVGIIQETRPVAYQYIEGKREEVLCQFKLVNDIVSFEILSDYDDCYELVIDPTLIFSTYSGSTADNWGNTATFDEDGNLYSGGITNHYNGGRFPTTSGAFQTTTTGFWDVAIIKYDSAGQDALYATYLGGEHSEVPQSLIVNENNELYIMGITSSRNFPVRTAAQPQFAGGVYSEAFGSANDNLYFNEGTDIFISRFNQNGTDLLSSTYVGGSANDGLMELLDPLTRNYGDQSRGDILIRKNGNVLVASKTASLDFPTVNALQDSFSAGEADAVLIELTPDLSQFIFSTYFGGSGMDAAYTVKENSAGNIIFGGGTLSQDIHNLHPTFSSNSYGGIDGWMAIIDGEVYTLDTGLYVGTSQYDQLYFVDIDAEDNVYTYGQTAGSFPVQGGAFTSGGGQFIQKWNSELTSVIASSKFGASGDAVDIVPTAFLVNDCDNIYLSGWGGVTNSPNPYLGGSTTGMPISSDAYQSTTVGSDFYLMTLTSDLSEFLYGTFLGGSQSNTHVDGGTSRFDKRGFVYHAVCAGCGQGGNSDFPTTPGVWSTTNNSQNCNNAAFKFDLASLRARIQTNTLSLDQPGIQTICFPELIVFQNLSIGGSEYIWDFGDGNSLTSPDTTFIVHTYENPGVYNVFLTAIDPNTCIGSDRTQTIVRVANPDVTTIPDTEICEGDRLQLWSIGAESYIWASQDSSFLSTERTPVIMPEESTIYYVQATDNFGCSVLDTVNVGVVSRSQLQFQVNRIDDCFSRTEFELINNSEGADSYLWVFGDGNTSDERNLVKDYERDGSYQLRFQGRDDFCVFEEVIDLEVVTIRVPNVFTPNSDETNDTFVIEAGANKIDLSLYNRWGREVYKNENYENEWNADGQPSGVYYYEAVIENQTTCRGWLQVLK